MKQLKERGLDAHFLQVFVFLMLNISCMYIIQPTRDSTDEIKLLLQFAINREFNPYRTINQPDPYMDKSNINSIS